MLTALFHVLQAQPMRVHRSRYYGKRAVLRCTCNDILRLRSHRELELRDQRPVIAFAKFTLDLAARSGSSELFARQDIIDAPADVLLTQVAPRRPPAEQSIVVGRELT